MDARSEFIKSIESFARRGWWRSKCEHDGNENLFFYIFFHVHPDYALDTAKLIRRALDEETLNVDWFFEEGKSGRFCLKPKEIGDLDSFEINESTILLAAKAHQDLYKIANAIRND